MSHLLSEGLLGQVLYRTGDEVYISQLRFREIKWLGRGPTASKWQRGLEHRAVWLPDLWGLPSPHNASRPTEDQHLHVNNAAELGYLPFPGGGRGKSYQSGSYTEPAKGQLPTQRHGRRRWGGTLRGRHNSAATEFYTYQILEETLLNPQTAESQHQTPLAREQTLVICYLLAGWPDTRSWSPHLPNREKRSTKPHREAMKTQLSKLPDAWGGPWRS